MDVIEYWKVYVGEHRSEDATTLDKAMLLFDDLSRRYPDDDIELYEVRETRIARAPLHKDDSHE